jgi:hypothetical protein
VSGTLPAAHLRLLEIDPAVAEGTAPFMRHVICSIRQFTETGAANTSIKTIDCLQSKSEQT